MPSHIELAIVKGIAPIDGDTNSAESPYEVLNLLSVRGFSVQENGWIPKLAQLKGGALYADNPLTDGRALVSNARGNVVETLKLTATAAAWDARYWLQARLVYLARDAQRFHTSDEQRQPVFLKWWAEGAPGAQYALIYSLEIAQQTDAFESVNINELTITIEREPYWRGLPPGANPKLWTLYRAGTTPTTSNVALYTGSDHLLTDTFENIHEWTNTGHTARTTQNFCTVPAASIPGDAPALVELYATTPTTFTGTTLVGRSTQPLSARNQSGTTIYNAFTVNAADAPGGDIAISEAADTGASLDDTGTRRRVVLTFAGSGTLYPRVVDHAAESNLFRGKHIVFCRCRTSATSTPVDLYLSTNGVATTPVRLNDAGAGGTSNTTEWAVVYLGMIDFDALPTAQAGIDGRGLFISGDGVVVNLAATRISGAGNLYINDLIFIPIDECAQSWTGFTNPIFYDNTGYMRHGHPVDSGQMWQTGPVAKYDGLPEIQGQPLTLEPGKDNHLFFFAYEDSTNRMSISGTYTVYLNIVPRWLGVRDV